MSCRELEQLVADGASESARAAHRTACDVCEAVGADLEETEQLTSGLQPPAWSAALRGALLAVPSRTVGCEHAAALIASAMETASSPDTISAADRVRLDFHLSRCEGCREAHETLSGARELQTPEPAPWFSGRLSASRPAKRRAGWRGLLDPRAAIGFAYAAAIVVMLAGFNPADLARRAEANFKSETKNAAAFAGGSLADRLGAFQDHASRSFAVWRGRAGGYGRAVLSNAIALVMKSDEPKRPQSRPRNGEVEAPRRNEIETASPTWRA